MCRFDADGKYHSVNSSAKGTVNVSAQLDTFASRGKQAGDPVGRTQAVNTSSKGARSRCAAERKNVNTTAKEAR